MRLVNARRWNLTRPNGALPKAGERPMIDGNTAVATAVGWWEASYVTGPNESPDGQNEPGHVHLLRAGRLANLRPINDHGEIRRTIPAGAVLCESVEVSTSRSPGLREYTGCVCESCVSRTVGYMIEWPPFVDLSESEGVE